MTTGGGDGEGMLSGGETVDCCGICRMQKTVSNSAQGQMKQYELNFFTCLTHRC